MGIGSGGTSTPRVLVRITTPGGFNPLNDLDSLIHYFDPQDTLDLEGDGNPIDTLVNTGPGDDLTGQTGATRPTIHDNVISGKPVFRFTGGTQRAWETGQDTNDGGTTGAMMFCVFKFTSAADNDIMVSMPETGNASGMQLFTQTAERGRGGIRLNANFFQAFSAIGQNDGNPHILILVWDPTLTGADRIKVFFDGSEVDNVDPGANNTLDTGMNEVVLGGRSSGLTLGFRGDLGICGICKASNTANVDDLEDFLNDHYGGGIF